MKRTVWAAAAMVAAVAALAAPAPASAAIKFFTGTTGYSGPFSGAGTVYNQIKNDALTCPTATPSCSGGDAVGNTLTYSGFTASRSGTTDQVNQDTQPAFGGLGVGTGNADLISGDDVLTITFNSTTSIFGIATLFENNGHGPFGGNPLTDSLQIAINGGGFQTITFAAINTVGTLFTGVNSISFKQLGGNAGFYVSGMITPLPGALLLFAPALAGLGVMSRRKAQAVAA